MKRGPIGQSAQTTELAGNPGKRSPRKPPPSLGAAAPNMTPPQHLSQLAKQFWRAWYEPLRRGRVLQAADVLAFELLCAAYARWRDAEAQLATEGAWTKATNGNRGPSPFFRIARQAADEIRAGCELFGLTPPSRARLETDISDAPGAFESDDDVARWQADQARAGPFGGLVGRDPRRDQKQ